jgi:pSer/pThr/pTyr-binding forkhead associated (FHA) protein
MAVCPSCGHETPDPEARFCAACGLPLTVAAAADVTSRLALDPGAPADEAAPDGVTDAAAADPSLVELLAGGSALLVVKQGPSSGARFLLDADTTTAGRHPDSDIFLDDITVSRKHAEFRRVADGFAVHDVGSLNGTYVNRKRVDDVVLVAGDEVQIGKYRLVYLIAAPSEDAA